MPQFLMPSLGADMTEGTVLQWLVHPGDTVHPGDVVAEVDTTKAAIEVECFDDGVIGEILVPEGSTVAVGTPLATIEPASMPAAQPQPTGPPLPTGEAVAETSAPHPAPASADKPPAESGRSPVAAHGNGERPDVLATPLIRRLAAEAGIDLHTVHGSAPGGRIVRADVDRLVAQEHRGGRPAGANGERTAVAEPIAAERGSTAPADRHVRASGYARRLARELWMDLAAVTGSGPGGAIRVADVRAAQRIATTAAAPRDGSGRMLGDGDASRAGGVSRAGGAEDSGRSLPGPAVPVPGEPAVTGTTAVPGRDQAAMRSLIAAAMTRSKRTVPHYYLSATIDMDAAMRWLRETNLRAPVSERILPPALLLRATALAARKVPQLNGFWVDDEFRPATDVHLGFVVSLRGGGIIVPTIAHADTLDVPAMMAALRGAVSRSREARLHAADTTPATLTVTNLGELGVDSVYGVIAAPQVAIVGFGAITERPCAVDGLLGVRPQLTVTLSADHRASDGAIGARFLNALADLIQRPEEL
ncbi:2-oxo acid dehydrogenase subunit E2 [Nocardia huaxiensis]|uniref:Dihydrolipoamide acetyltransferase component of pyruvate dehydrogenase complex n=1 Tax=Nocardia huaxiensis TaxID=2755382 RepID=A0A7D6VBW7_9NOCA|nr:2-oxo acid dehydrogenase subunit E2 [Nocardia huaxiensis]QLY28595.1 2-oxo acid dehydrogenase subunit E2 [Nocardia huaxiensis]